MKDLLFIGISSMFAEICTHPLDFVKTQKQYKKLMFQHLVYLKKY